MDRHAQGTQPGKTGIVSGVPRIGDDGIEMSVAVEIGDGKGGFGLNKMVVGAVGLLLLGGIAALTCWSLIRMDGWSEGMAACVLLALIGSPAGLVIFVVLAYVLNDLEDLETVLVPRTALAHLIDDGIVTHALVVVAPQRLEAELV